MSGRYEEWLAKAEDDLKFAEVGLREGFFSQVCFLSQQVIEKSLKGALVFQNRSYPKSHGLRELSKLVSDIHLAEFSESLSIIDGYYVPIRHPDAMPGMGAAGSPNEKEAEEALDTAREVFSIVAEFIASK